MPDVMHSLSIPRVPVEPFSPPFHPQFGRMEINRGAYLKSKDSRYSAGKCPVFKLEGEIKYFS